LLALAKEGIEKGKVVSGLYIVCHQNNR